MCYAPLVHVIVFSVRGLSWSKGTTNIVMSFRDFLKDLLIILFNSYDWAVNTGIIP